jgi:lipopolysaccharide transport system ATP-binding protein
MIEVRELAKSYKLYRKPADRLREIFWRRPFHTRHQALEAISFTVKSGETLGVIGRNGAGKSTLLKILNGVVIADTGEVHSSGRVTGLLELGTGFDVNLSGEHNIRSNGLLLGMTEEEVSARTAAIIEFAELGDYIYEPLRTYSSGMTMRLAFAIAIHAEPDTFLIDEALSVGDGRFQQKCMRRIREFRSEGGSIVFVSHDLNAVKMLCDRVIVLSEGRVVADGDPEHAVNHYNQLLAGDDSGETGESVIEGGYGNFKAAITQVTALGVDSRGTLLSSGEEMELRVAIEGRVKIPAISLGMVIRDRFGQDMFGTNSHLLDEQLSLDAGEKFTLCFRFPMNLAPGKYTVTLALHEGIDHTQHCYHWWDNAVTFEVSGIRGHQFGGLCNLHPTLIRL